MGASNLDPRDLGPFRSQTPTAPKGLTGRRLELRRIMAVLSMREASSYISRQKAARDTTRLISGVVLPHQGKCPDHPSAVSTGCLTQWGPLKHFT